MAEIDGQNVEDIPSFYETGAYCFEPIVHSVSSEIQAINGLQNGSESDSASTESEEEETEASASALYVQPALFLMMHV